VLEAEERGEGLQRRAAHQHGPGRDRERDGDDDRSDTPGEPLPSPRDEEDAGDGEPQPDDGNQGARQHDADGAGNSAGNRPAPPHQPVVAQRDRHEPDDERCSREGREVVDADE
jgi:hypothetical protein